MNKVDILLEKEDEIALRTRLHLLCDENSEETEYLQKRVVKNLSEVQNSNGSWNNTIYRTLQNLHLLIDTQNQDTKMFSRGFQWILSLKGPQGFHEYGEEGQKVYCRDEECPFGSMLGAPEFTGRVLYLFGRMTYENPIVNESVANIMQFRRADGGFHGTRYWEEDKRSCIGATLWVARGLLSLGRETEVVEGAVHFIEQEKIFESPHQFPISALTLETLFLHSQKETAIVKHHIQYLLGLRRGMNWELPSTNGKKYRENLFFVLNALRKFRKNTFY
jgi:prenyltransferase beta subunit